MNFEKYTTKLQNIVRQAQSLALSKDNTSIGSVHLLAAMLADASVMSLLQNAKANLSVLQGETQALLERQAVTPTPTGQINLGADAAQVLNLTQSLSAKAGDEFVASEWLLLALASQTDTKKVFAQAGVSTDTLTKLIQTIRGDNTVNTQNAEETRNALEKYTINLTDRARDHGLGRLG